MFTPGCESSFVNTSQCVIGHIVAAFWDATRAFMLLSVLSCFAGVVLGLSAFTNGTKNRRVRTGGIALVLSGTLFEKKEEKRKRKKSESSNKLCSDPLFNPRFSCSAGSRYLHWSDCDFLRQTLLGLALLLVLHHRLGGHHTGVRSRYLIFFFFFSQ